ncbi:MAG: carboxypeptidase-like regulatory domain-containing protein, partial [Sphingobacterium sp.]
MNSLPGILVILILLSADFAFSQSKEIVGRVIDTENNVIAGTSVSIKGSELSTLADEKGIFMIPATATDTLVFSFIGFTTQEILVAQQTDLTVILVSQDNQLDEVAVVGFGTQRK